MIAAPDDYRRRAIRQVLMSAAAAQVAKRCSHLDDIKPMDANAADYYAKQILAELEDWKV